MATKKCRHCECDLDWRGRCQLEQATRQPKPIALVMLLVIVLLAGCTTTHVRPVYGCIAWPFGVLGGCISRTFNIDPQPLAEALTEWAELTGYQIIVPHDPATEAPSRRVSGTNAVAALNELLDGTGLTYHWINARTVAIRCPT